MKIRLILSLALILYLYADDLVTSDGYIRVGFQHQDSSEFAIGGKFHVDSNPSDWLGVGASFYTTNGIDKKHNDGISFFSSDIRSYSILGEAYLKTKFLNTDIKVGRQELDTPYADTDDVGMIPNTFEALTFANSSFIDTTISMAYLKKMSGVDSQRAEKFNSIGDVYSIGITHEGFENIVLNVWYYDVDNLVKMSYIEAGYGKKFADLSFDFDFQYSNQKFDQTGEVDIYGASLGVTKDRITLSVAYDKADSTDGQVAENFFGGGPFFINCEHITMMEIGENAKGVRYGVGYSLDNLYVSLSYLKADGAESDLHEVDVVANYEISSNLTFDLIYSDVTDELDKSQSFKNSRVFVNYSF